MDAKTETALRQSIEKWEKNSRIEELEEALLGMSNCPLCKLFYRDSCTGCPVSEFTLTTCCEGTPNETAEIKHSDFEFDGFIAAAKCEVVFLKSLLPENNQ